MEQSHGVLLVSVPQDTHFEEQVWKQRLVHFLGGGGLGFIFDVVIQLLSFAVLGSHLGILRLYVIIRDSWSIY
jgi:hypothetical protein